MIEVTGRRRLLREATTEAHEGLERQIGPMTSRDAYVAYCQGLLAFRGPLEQALRDCLPPLHGWTPTFIASPLAIDLVDLGARPLPPEPRPSLDPATALGALYVLEGSALGARVLTVQARALGLGATFGARHLARQAASLESWRGYVRMLEASRWFDPLRTVAGANAAFTAAARAMARTPQHA